mgnify:CR=1 FL=1
MGTIKDAAIDVAAYPDGEYTASEVADVLRKRLIWEFQNGITLSDFQTWCNSEHFSNEEMEKILEIMLEEDLIIGEKIICDQ